MMATDKWDSPSHRPRRYKLRDPKKKPIIPYEPGEEEIWNVLTRGWDFDDG